MRELRPLKSTATGRLTTTGSWLTSIARSSNFRAFGLILLGVGSALSLAVFIGQHFQKMVRTFKLNLYPLLVVVSYNMKRKRQKQRKFNSVRHLRNFLEKTQQAFASHIARCSRFSIESIETNRLALSAALGAKIAAATNCDYRWLMSNDEKLPFINSDGRPYAKEDAERASEKDASESIQFAHSGPEVAVLIGADLLLRVLQAAQARNAVSEFISRFENYVRSEVGRFAALQDEIYAEIRGRTSSSLAFFIYARSTEPLRRIRRRATAAIQAVKAREKAIKK